MTLQDIKRISIRAYLGAIGIKPQWERGNRAMYLSPFRHEENASFSVTTIRMFGTTTESVRAGRSSTL